MNNFTRFAGLPPIGFPYDPRTPREREIDDHWEAWLNGELDNCSCDLCYEWDKEAREQLKERTGK